MVASEAFFQRKQAAAVLKQGILSRYPRVFATMAGKRTGLVVYFDGYAGPGRYEDGSPGSPLLAVETARATSRWDRDVECLFAENPTFAADLERTLDAEATMTRPCRVSGWGKLCHAHAGKADEHRTGVRQR